MFADEGKRRELEGILHPIVIEETKREMELARAQGCAVCVLDVPLLFESGMERLCDETWVVYVPRQEQLRRVMARDGLNSGSMERTREQLRALWEELA